MARIFSQLALSGLVCVASLSLPTAAQAQSRQMYQRYSQQQMQQQQQMMQMQQKAMMQAIAEQQAIEKKEADNQAKAAKSARDKAEQRKQNIIARRKAAQSGTSADSTKK